MKVMAAPVINSGDASLATVKKLEAALDLLPRYVREGLEDNNYQIIVGRVLSSTHPLLPEGGGAFHSPACQKIYCSEFYIDQKSEKERQTDIGAAIAHEIGHFVDLFLMGVQKYPNGRASNQMDFQEAVRKDMERLIKIGFRQVSEAAKNSIHTYQGDTTWAVDHFKKIFVGNLNGRREIYAEIFANILGQSASFDFPIRPFFPRCAALIQDGHNRLNNAAPERAGRLFQRTRKYSIGSP